MTSCCTCSKSAEKPLLAVVARSSTPLITAPAACNAKVAFLGALYSSGESRPAVIRLKIEWAVGRLDQRNGIFPALSSGDVFWYPRYLSAIGIGIRRDPD